MRFLSILLICGSIIVNCDSSVPMKFTIPSLYDVFINVIGGIANFDSIYRSLSEVFAIVVNSTMPAILETIFDPYNPVPEDSYLNITQLATKYGYIMETHRVTTEDGYILKMFRIPGKKEGRTIFLMHGILDSADCWILNGKDKALGYILADAGYDVWMGNARGNKHSLKHTTLSPRHAEFWQFSWDEIGYYDLPAMIDYVLETTRKEKLYYVGHSQGTTVFYVMASLRPDYNDKVTIMFSLAPIAWVKHAKTPYITIFSPAHKVLSWILSNFNTLSPSSEYFNRINTFVCSFLSIQTVLCEHNLFMIIGFDFQMMNHSMLPVIYGHMPGGSSTYQFVHYGQLVENGRFCRFDYGVSRNLEVYGRPSPPDYDLNKVTVPIALYYSSNDWMSDPLDVEVLRRHLSDVFDYYLVPYKYFNHLDYLYADVAKEIIYSRIMDFIDKYEMGYNFNNSMIRGLLN